MTPRTPEQFEGTEAVDFAERHLRKVKVNPQTWEIEYDDPKTGEKWLMDYPNSEAQGGGSPRLRKIACGNKK
jgi:Immunity protein 27